MTKRIDIFNMDIDKLEKALSIWEEQHILENGKPECKDVRCQGNYLMCLTAYNYRVRIQKVPNLVTLFGYEKMGTKEENYFNVRGLTVRKIKRGDCVILRDAFPGVDHKYRVEEIEYIENKNSIRYFNSKMSFIDFATNIQKN